MAKSSDDAIPTRQSLLLRLRDWDDQESWREFFNTYWQLLYNAATRAGLADAAAQDVVQETIISVSKGMPDFRYDPAIGSFKSWLRKIVRQRIRDHLRRVYREPLRAERGPEDTGSTLLVDRLPAPVDPTLGSSWEVGWEKNVFEVAVERVRQQVDTTQFQVFEACVFQERPVPEVTRAFGVSAANVYVIKHRISALIKKEVKRLEEGPIGR